MARTRVTISLDCDSPSDKTVLEFLWGLPRRTRSEIVKEILLAALEARTQETNSAAKPAPENEANKDLEDLITRLF